MGRQTAGDFRGAICAATAMLESRRREQRRRRQRLVLVHEVEAERRRHWTRPMAPQAPRQLRLA